MDNRIASRSSSSYRLYPEGALTFFDVDFGFTLEFVSDEGGGIDEVILNRGGVVSTMPRVPDSSTLSAPGQK